MESALIISNTQKSAALFAEILHAASINHIVILNSCGEARRLLLEQDYDFLSFSWFYTKNPEHALKTF